MILFWMRKPCNSCQYSALCHAGCFHPWIERFITLYNFQRSIHINWNTLYVCITSRKNSLNCNLRINVHVHVPLWHRTQICLSTVHVQHCAYSWNANIPGKHNQMDVACWHAVDVPNIPVCSDRSRLPLERSSIPSHPAWHSDGRFQGDATWK